eukprot:3466382-Rhodomonas_salina.2
MLMLGDRPQLHWRENEVPRKWPGRLGELDRLAARRGPRLCVREKKILRRGNSTCAVYCKSLGPDVNLKRVHLGSSSNAPRTKWQSRRTSSRKYTSAAIIMTEHTCCTL